MGKLYVQYGCGLCAPEGWRNFDASPTLRLQRLPVVGPLFAYLPTLQWPVGAEYGEIVQGLPIDDCSADAVYCSHILEHLGLEDCRRAIANTFRMLTPGGILRLVMPDFEYYARQYVAARDAGTPQAGVFWFGEMHVGMTVTPKTLIGRLRTAGGLGAHRWLWDYADFKALLEEAGFVAVRRAAMRDSGDPMFEAVECDEDRWKNALGMQARRPR